MRERVALIGRVFALLVIAAYLVFLVYVGWIPSR